MGSRIPNLGSRTSSKLFFMELSTKENAIYSNLVSLDRVYIMWLTHVLQSLIYIHARVPLGQLKVIDASRHSVLSSCGEGGYTLCKHSTASDTQRGYQPELRTSYLALLKWVGTIQYQLSLHIMKVQGIIACVKSPRLIIGLEGRRLLQPLTLGFPVPLLTPSLINAKQAPPFSHMKQEMQYLPRQPH